MADFDINKFNKAMSGIGSGLGVLGSWGMSYLNTLKAQTNNAYMSDLQQYANANYGGSIEDLMSQANNTILPQSLNTKDLYNPSQGEIFGSMFGAGLGAYGAAKRATKELNNMNFNNAVQLKDNEIPSQGAINPSTNLYDLENTQAQINNIVNSYGSNNPIYKMNALGGQLNNGGGALSTGLNLLSSGIGMALNYAGIANQKKKAGYEADEYNAVRQYAEQLNQHNFNNAVRDTKNNMFNQYALQMMANGGPLFTQGLEFPMNGNYREINSGGSHEANPNGGVPQGLAQDGQQNLVEQGEVIWNDYVFSDSRRKDKKYNTPDLKIPQDLLDKYKELNANMTFADAAKKLSKESEERPNDYISQNGLKATLGDLRVAQETVKQEQEAKKLKREINKMSPEELMQLQAMLSQGQGQPMQQGMFALGGHLFEGNKEKSNQMTKSQSRNLLEQVGAGNTGLERLLELASGYAGFDKNNFNTTSIAPIIDFILSRENNYTNLQNAINSKMILNRMEDNKLPDYQYTTTDATDWNSLFDVMNNYVESSKRANSKYKYYADPRFMYDNKNTSALENDDNYNQFTEYVLANPDNENVQKYLKLLDEKINTETGARKLFDENGNLVNDWQNIYKDRRYDDIGGIYHFFQNLKDKTQGNRTIYRLNGQNVVVDDPEKLSKFLRETGRQNTIEFDEEGNPLTTTYIDLTGDTYSIADSQLPKDTDVVLLNTTPRYAPILGSLMGTIGALTEQPRDYSTSVPMQRSTNTPIGNYLEYNPVDTQRYINNLNQQAAAQNAAIMNASGANKNAAIANMMFADRQRQQNFADILNQAEQINFARRQAVGDFNRGTDQFNAQGFNQAELANLDLNKLNLNQAQQNAASRMAVDNAMDMAKSENLTNLFDNLGAIGQENLAYNMVNSNKALDYWAAINGISSYKKLFGGSLIKNNRRR